MKNQKNTKTTLGIIAFFIFFIGLSSAKSQTCCPFKITNNLSCAVTICYDFVDPSCAVLCAACNVTIAPNGGSVSTGCCSAGMDCYVTVTSPFWSGTVNGLSSPGCNGGAFNPTDSGSGPAGCDPTYNISWTCNGVTINP